MEPGESLNCRAQRTSAWWAFVINRYSGRESSWESRTWSLTPPYKVRNFAKGNRDRHREIVVESNNRSRFLKRKGFCSASIPRERKRSNVFQKSSSKRAAGR